MNIQIFHDRTPQFWQHMGPFFASRAIRKDLPSLCDEPGRIWFLSWSQGSVVAFASLDCDGAVGHIVGHLRNLYVQPGRRGEGHASALMAARLTYLREQGITKARTTRRVSKEVQFAENYGFHVLRVESNWEILEADLSLPAPESESSPSLDPPQAASSADKTSSRILHTGVWQAGNDAAVKRMEERRKLGRKFLKSRPLRKDYAAFADPILWEEFTAGWVAAVSARYKEVVTWQDDAPTAKESAS